MIDLSRVGNNILAVGIILFFFVIIASKMTKKPVSEMLSDIISLFHKKEDNYNEPRGFNK